ncbi:MAG: DNA-binding response regulator [Bacillota bacterium]
MKKIKVMLVEDDTFWQRRLSVDLGWEEDIEVIKIASAKEEALAAAKALDLDVVLMDIHLAADRLDGLELTREILTAKPGQVKVIMLTSLDEQAVIIKSFQNGAVNFINKSNYRDIVQAIRDADRNTPSIHPDAIPAIMKEMQLSILTPAEKEVYLLKEKGLSKTEISNRLHKSVSTIKTQMRHIKHKLIQKKEGR